MFGAPLHGAFDNMGETSGYVTEKILPIMLTLNLTLNNYFCQTDKTNEIEFASLESMDSELNLFEGDIAGINGLDVLAGQEVIPLTLELK